MQAIVFDLDHTLLFSTLDLIRMRKEMYAYLCRFMDKGVLSEELVAAELMRIASHYDAVNRTNHLQALEAIATSHEQAALREATIADETHDTLQELKKRGFSLAVLTNNSRTSTQEALTRFGLREFFSIVLTRDDVKKMKPEPDGLLTLCKRWALPPADILMVGDGWPDGMAAKYAGCPFIAFRMPSHVIERYDLHPLGRIEHLSELLSILFAC
ncbi:phosphoglycolate phosphatase [Collibacillus ludicampi]|uniref:Phosphoglycolate phosphatase n=1 Tax=Collibacillus ludicampi TaxID=2771369 RepID=A0AAV4LEP1_9BACL|nr:HAD family hydrolase [Collibacillus ludicampi]GIM46238.1 phosphoglycolate phosphatase [Collibacillus ludicampi]